MPFGPTNAVAAFQRKMDEFIAQNHLSGTFAYLDNITVAGMNQSEHDHNYSILLEAASKSNLTFNENKSILSVESINILGYVISQNSIKPDPERLQPLKNLPTPSNSKAKQRAVGLFSYYSKFIKNYSQKVRPLLEAESYPLGSTAINAFESLKTDIENAVVNHIDENIPFVLETDASDHSIAATLNQNSRPVAFFSKSLDKHQKCHPAVEKEALAIIESVRKWKHYLTGHHFTLTILHRPGSLGLYFRSKRTW